MSAISGFINTIRNAVYGEQVRTAIINAITQCYSDVNNPSLQTEAFEAALNEAYAGGILDIQEVTTVSQMTNEEIIYRYMGTETGYVANMLYYHNGTAWVPIGSGVQEAATAALMTNTGSIYKYTGSESGYTSNALYYNNGTEWVTVSPLSPSTLDTFFDALYNLIVHLAGLFDDLDGMTYINDLAEAMGKGYFYIQDLSTLTISEFAPLITSISGNQITLS